MANGLCEQVAALFSRTLNLDVPSIETDLFETGVLDSLAFVDLVLALERHFGVTTSLEDLETDNFRTISRIADFVAARELSPQPDGENSQICT
jgi:methoxymalonate biosynthesis acyl carrier protein